MNSLATKTDKGVILTVSKNRTSLELMLRKFGSVGYETVHAASLDEFDEVFEDKQNNALVLVDLSGFDERIWQRCELMRKADIPYTAVSFHRNSDCKTD